MTNPADQLEKDLHEINALIDNNKIEGENEAGDKFKKHLAFAIQVGSYDKRTWRYSWISLVYDFGTKFEEKDPRIFLDILSEIRATAEQAEKEVLDFYRSEIEINSIPKEEANTSLSHLIKDYPYNPEFRNTIGTILTDTGDHEKAIENHEFAFKKNSSSPSFAKDLFSAYKEYMDFLIVNQEHKNAKKLCEDIVDNRTFGGYGFENYHNYFVNYQDRLADLIFFTERFNTVEFSMKENIAKESQKAQFKVIEILSFFTAIIAFIFSTVSIGKNFSFKEAIIFNGSLGVILMTFVLMLNLIFTTKKVTILDFRILILTALIVAFLLILFCVPV